MVWDGKGKGGGQRRGRFLGAGLGYVVPMSNSFGGFSSLIFGVLGFRVFFTTVSHTFISVSGVFSLSFFTFGVLGFLCFLIIPETRTRACFLSFLSFLSFVSFLSFAPFLSFVSFLSF